MFQRRANIIARRVIFLMLCAALGLTSVLAYDVHMIPAVGATVAAAESTDTAILDTLVFGYLSPSVETVVDTVNSADAMTAARESVITIPAAPVEDKTVWNPTAHTISKSSANTLTDAQKANASALGNFRLSFYCDCAICNGRSDGLTRIGTRMAEGRTIAVDSRVIPLGSKVYIEGYGVFIAEDTGGAIKGNRIDVCVSGHSRAYDFGIDYANVYLLD